jgi:hypothetical protein
MADSTSDANLITLQDIQPLFTFAELNAMDTTQASGFGQLFANPSHATEW